MVEVLLNSAKPDMSVICSPDDVPPLHRAAWTGNSEIVGLLLGAGANVDCVNSGGKTPLCFAVRFGKVEVVAALLQAGANPNAADFSGMRLLTGACQDEQAPAIRDLLVHAGAVVTPYVRRVCASRAGMEVAVRVYDHWDGGGLRYLWCKCVVVFALLGR